MSPKSLPIKLITICLTFIAVTPNAEAQQPDCGYFCGAIASWNETANQIRWAVGSDAPEYRIAICESFLALRRAELNECNCGQFPGVPLDHGHRIQPDPLQPGQRPSNMMEAR